MSKPAFKPPERCPFCMKPGTVEVLTDDVWEFRDRNGRSFQVADYVCFNCTACGEKSVNADMDKINHPRTLDARRVSESLLSGAEIKRIVEQVKERYGFSEAQLEDILGIGAKSFTRWKAGTVCQSQTADALLRALDKHPDFIEDIAQARGIPLVPIKRGRPATKKPVARAKPQRRTAQASKPKARKKG